MKDYYHLFHHCILVIWSHTDACRDRQRDTLGHMVSTHPQFPAAHAHVALLDYIIEVGGHL